MGKRRQLELGRAATLVHYPPAGVPSAATVSVYQGASALLEDQAATVDPYDEAFVDLERFERNVTVTAAPTLGERYWLADALGTGQEVVCAGGDATTFVCDDVVGRAIAAGSIKGRRISYTLATDYTAEVARRLRVRWAYTVGGLDVVRTELVDIVRWPFELVVTEEDLEAAEPSFGELSSQFGAWRGLIERAVDDVWDWLVAQHIRPDLVRDRELLHSAVVWRTLQLRSVGDAQKFASLGQLYTEALRLFAASDAWYDSDDDFDSDDGAEAPRLNFG